MRAGEEIRVESRQLKVRSQQRPRLIEQLAFRSRGNCSARALMIGGKPPTTSNFPQAGFWSAITSGLPVTRPEPLVMPNCTGAGRLLTVHAPKGCKYPQSLRQSQCSRCIFSLAYRRQIGTILNGVRGVTGRFSRSGLRARNGFRMSCFSGVESTPLKFA